MRRQNLLNFGSRWQCLVNISSEKLEFYEYKMYLELEIVAPT